MRRRLAISPGFSDHYQDLGILDFKGPDFACSLILIVGKSQRKNTNLVRTLARTPKEGFLCAPRLSPHPHPLWLNKGLFEVTYNKSNHEKVHTEIEGFPPVTFHQYHELYYVFIMLGHTQVLACGQTRGQGYVARGRGRRAGRRTTKALRWHEKTVD